MRTLLCAGLAVVTLGCVSSGDISLLHREITDVSRQVEELGRQSSGKEDVQAMEQKLADHSAQLLKSNADIRVQLEQLRDQLETLQSNLDATNQRLEALSNELAATRERLAGGPPATIAAPPGEGAAGQSAAPPGSATTQPSEPAQLYGSAYEDYLRGSYDLAIQGFAEYRKRYPETDLDDNSLYWVGECHYSKREFPQAIEAFTELLNHYKASDKAAAALLKKGLAYLEADDRSQAVINLQYVLYEHPGSKEAELARNRLASLGIKVK
ncbi:MAG: tol-pal system protein YbgF [Acidobacteriota bacterium]